MNYYVKNSIHVVEVPIEDFKIVMCDSKKKSAANRDFVNAGFFGNFAENGSKFTLPVGHLVCDYDADSEWVEHYCKQRGPLVGTKYGHDVNSYPNQFKGKVVSTFVIQGGRASIKDLAALPPCDYAISGIPVMCDGKDIKFDPYVIGQGWEASSLYATWHTFIGLKEDDKIIYVMGMKTTTGNMIRSAEAFKKFKALGMRDVIKLDGGGSFIMNVGGKNVASTLENRRINTIITFESKSENPYEVPTVTLTYGNKHKEFNRWLQWQLSFHGFMCDIDGSFGPNTKKQVLAFQKSKGLVQDASVGPATRAALLDV